MIKEGALNDPRPAAIFGLHAWPLIPVGQIGYVSGPAMASADRFVITVKGKKTHGAAPHLGVDAIVVASEAVMALQTIHARRIDPLSPAVLSIGMMHGGNRFNIIADEVTLEGTVRALDPETRKIVREEMDRVLGGVTSAHGATYTMRYQESAAVTRNDPALVEASLPALRRALGAANVHPSPPHMGAEDFAYYEQVVPGFFFFLGVRNEKNGITAMLHTPEFDLDEDALAVGARAMATLAVDYLSRHAR
jgi:amidohydrolase